MENALGVGQEIGHEILIAPKRKVLSGKALRIPPAGPCGRRERWKGREGSRSPISRASAYDKWVREAFGAAAFHFGGESVVFMSGAVGQIVDRRISREELGLVDEQASTGQRLIDIVVVVPVPRVGSDGGTRNALLPL